MVDIAKFILDNVIFILSSVLIVVGLVIGYFVWKKQKLKVRAQYSSQSKVKGPDAELMKTNLPTKSGIITKGRLDKAIQNNQKNGTATTKGVGKKGVGKRRRVARKRTAKRRTTRRRTTRRR